MLPLYRGGESFPSVMASPAVIRVAGGVDAGTALGQGVLSRYAAQIGHFLAAQRQNAAIGGATIWQSTRQYGDVKLTYNLRFGQETLTVEAPPEVVRRVEEEVAQPAPESLEIDDENLDGHITLFQFPSTQPENVSYTVKLNGRGLEAINMPSGPGMWGAWIIKFGDTAMRLRSVNDANNPHNPDRLLPAVRPARRDDPTTSVDEYGNTWEVGPQLYYDAYGFSSPVLLAVASDPRNNEPTDPPDHYTPPGTQPTIYGESSYSVGEDSPLNARGPNLLSITGTAQAHNVFGLAGYVCAEFFSRTKSKYRLVQQGWRRFDPQGYARVRVNDYPMLFTDVLGAAGIEDPYRFDLSPEGSTLRVQIFIVRNTG